MGIYIKGRKMPGSCFDCPCFNGVSGWCDADENIPTPSNPYTDSLPDDCPLIEVPTADVVEVVRCKDCKWWSLPENITADFYICKKFDGVRYGEDYCSRGERTVPKRT